MGEGDGMRFVPCDRCQGQMIHVTMSDFFVVVPALKCVQCGNIIDKVIAENRYLSQQINHKPKT